MSSNVQLLASAVALSTSLTASTNSATISGLGKHTVFIEWTPGTAANVLTVAVDTRVQGVSAGEWTQQMTWDEATVASGTRTNTRTLEQYQHTAANTTLIPFQILLEGHGHDLRIRYAESEAGSSTKGTITAYVISSNT